MQNYEIEPRLFDLLSNKKIEELEPEEKELVIKNLGSMAEFEKMQNAIHLSSIFFENEKEIELPSSLKTFSGWQKNKNVRAKILRIKMPVYQAIIAYAAVFAIVFFVWNSRPIQVLESNNQNNSTSSIIRDTVKTIIYDTVIIVKTIHPSIQSSDETDNYFAQNNIDSNNNPTNNASYQMMDSNPFFGLKNLRLIGKQKTGISMSDDTVLSNFKFTLLN